MVELAARLMVLIMNMYTKYLALFWFKFFQWSTAYLFKQRDEKLLEKKWKKGVVTWFMLPY